MSSNREIQQKIDALRSAIAKKKQAVVYKPSRNRTLIVSPDQQTQYIRQSNRLVRVQEKPEQ